MSVTDAPVALAGDTVGAIVIAPGNPPTLYAGLEVGGVVKGDDGGMTWTPSNNGLPNSRLTALVIDPKNPTTLYAAVYVDGVFKTTDGARSWRSVNNGMGDPRFAEHHVSCVTIDPQMPTTLYASLSLGGVLYKSTDGGESWHSAANGLQPPYGAGCVAIDPHASTVLYTTTANGVSKSIDGGASWSLASNGLSASAWAGNIVLDPDAPGTIYVGSAAGCFKSVDAAQTWTRLHLGPPDDRNCRIVFRARSGALLAKTGGRLMKSTDAGANWTLLHHDDESDFLSAFGQNITTGLIYAGTYRGKLLQSADSGSTFSSIAGRISPAVDVTTLAIDSASPTTLYVGTWPLGVFRSTNRGDQWSKINNGLPAPTEVSALVPNPTQIGTVFGLINRKPYILKGDSWLTMRDFQIDSLAAACVGGTCTLYIGGANEVLRRSDDGVTWESFELMHLDPDSIGSPGAIPIVLSLRVDPIAPKTLFAGTNEWGLFKSTDGGRSWRRVDTPGQLLTVNLSQLVIAPTKPETFYSGYGHGLRRSTDGGKTWHSLTDGLPRGDVPYTSVGDVAVDPRNPRHVYAAIYTNLFETTDGGVRWRPLITALPRARITAVAIAPKSPNVMYVGTHGQGVLRSTDSGVTWKEVNQGLTE